MRPRIAKRRWCWQVTVNGQLAGAWQTWERAFTHAQRIAEHPHRQRAYRELERARLALERMENNR